MKRSDMLSKISQKDRVWDVAIIGGGATGLGCAVDAASRGFSTVLIEKHDFAKGTSSRSTKLVHGGVRYLAQGDIALVLEALKERGLLLDNARHLVKNQKFVIPSYDWWAGPFYAIGLKVYDKMAGQFGLGPSEHLNKKETVAAIPNVLQKGLNGGVIYHDGQFDDARLAINLAQTAANKGCTILNYCAVDGLLKNEDGFVEGLSVIDRETGEKINVKAKSVINATGVFADDILRMDNPEAKRSIKPSQGVHLVLDKRFLKGDKAIMIPKTDDGRVLFLVPWHDVVIVGTTDSPKKKPKIEPLATEEEIGFILDNANRYLTEKPKRSDVLSVFAGLRPLYFKPESDGKKTKSISRNHRVLVSKSGLISVVGGKWTTYRKMGEDAIDKAIMVGNLEDCISVTKNLKIHGWTNSDPEEFAIYGSDADLLKQLRDSDPAYAELIHPAFDLTVAQVIWAVREEMARTVDDVLARRHRALLFNASAAKQAASKVAAIMAKELNQDDDWQAQQVEEFHSIADEYILT